MEKKKFTFQVLYQLCNKEQLFTGGDNKQYSKMFEMAEEGLTKNELAIILYICSIYKLDEIHKMIEPLFENEGGDTL